MKRTDQYHIVILIILVMLLSLLITLNEFDFFEEEEIDPNAIKIGMLDSGVPFPSNDVVKKSFVKTELGYYESENEYDLFGHGTSIYNILKKSIFNTSVQLYSGKVFDIDGEASFPAVEEGLKWFQQENVDIVLLSLGTEASIYTKGAEIIIHEMALNNIIVIAASGNEGNIDYPNVGIGNFPAILPYVIGVGGVDRLGESAYYNSIGRTLLETYSIDIAEYGVGDVLGELGSGTSFAVPRIAGTVARLLSEARNLNIKINVNSVKAILAESTGNEFSVGRGFGLPSIEKALEILKAKTPIFKFHWDSNDFINHDRFEDEKYSFKIYLSHFIPGPEGSTTNLDYRLLYHTVNEIDYNAYALDPTYSFVEINIKQMHISSEMTLQFNYLNVIYETIIKINIVGNSTSKLLFDYQYVEDLELHEYGRFYELDNILRSHNIMTKHNTTTDYQEFDYIFRPYSDVYPSIFNNELDNWIFNGGIYIETFDIYTELNYEESIAYNLDINLIDLGKNAQRIQTNSSHILSNDTSEYYFEGIGFDVTGIGSSYTAFASTFTDIPVGLVINYGQGKIILYGSSISVDNYGLFKSQYNTFFNNLLYI